MTMDQWKAKKVQMFMQEIHGIPLDVAEQWMAEHNYNCSIAVSNWNALY